VAFHAGDYGRGHDVAQIVSVQAGSVTQAQTELIESETEITTTKESET
jgi:hypothetical protein